MSIVKVGEGHLGEHSEGEGGASEQVTELFRRTWLSHLTFPSHFSLVYPKSEVNFPLRFLVKETALWSPLRSISSGFLSEQKAHSYVS